MDWKQTKIHFSQLTTLRLAKLFWDLSQLSALPQLMFGRGGELASVEWLHREGDGNVLLSWEGISQICQYAERLVDFFQDVNMLDWSAFWSEERTWSSSLLFSYQHHGLIHGFDPHLARALAFKPVFRWLELLWGLGELPLLPPTMAEAAHQVFA